jgi:hypothetical protein
MNTIFEQSHELSGCYKDQVQELAELCDHEYYMSALPHATNKDRSMRGHLRISDAVEEFKKLLEITECKPCRDKIINQIMLQEENLREIEIVWKLKND